MSTSDIIDVAIKILGAVAICVPIWLFYQQQKKQTEVQRAEMQIDLYTNAAVDLYFIFEKTKYTDLMDVRKEKPLYEYGTKIKLFFPKEIYEQYLVVKDRIEVYIMSLKFLETKQTIDLAYLNIRRKLYPEMQMEFDIADLKESISHLRNVLGKINVTVSNIEDELVKSAYPSESVEVKMFLLKNLIPEFRKVYLTKMEVVKRLQTSASEIENYIKFPPEHSSTTTWAFKGMSGILTEETTDSSYLTAALPIRQFQNLMLSKLQKLDDLVIQDNQLLRSKSAS